MRLLILSFFICFNLLGQQALVYPKANTGNEVDTIWGRIVKDPYRWMENINSTETNEWLSAQKQLADRNRAKSFSTLQECITNYSYVQFKRLIKQGKYYFSFMIQATNNTASLYAQQFTYTEPILVLDPNVLDRKAATHIDNIELSHDNNTLGLSLSKNGSDWKTIRFLNMNNNKLLNDTINFVREVNNQNTMRWFMDGVFYVRYNVADIKESFSKTVKGQSLYYHKLGTKQSEDKLIYKPKNKTGSFEFDVTPEGKYLVLYKDTVIDKTQLFQVSYSVLKDDLSASFKTFISLIPTKGKWPTVNVLGELNGKLLVQSTFNVPTGAVFKYDINGINKKEMLITPFKNQLEFAKIVGNKIITVLSDDTSSFTLLWDSLGNRVHSLKTPSGYKFDKNHFSYSKTDNTLLLSFYSFFCPPTIYQYNVNTFKAEALGNTYIQFETKRFVTKKVYYYSKDSTLVPMYITYKGKIKLTGNNPVLLYGYGGFGISMEPFYDAANVVFMENGGVLATPGIRGGGEYMGWHEKGNRLNKQNSFDDFIAAAQYLITNKYTNPDRLAIMGGSNGGLLVGAVMLQRPDLFKAVVSQAGLFDMLRFHLYDLNYLNKGEYGSIKDSADFKNLIGYSPVQNVKEGIRYPATLLVASDNDNRVSPFHSFKFIAALQSVASGTEPFLLYYEKGGGHSGSAVFEKRMETSAYIYSFIFNQLGMKARTW